MPSTNTLTTIQASLQVCELLNELRKCWGEWEKQQSYYCNELLPQLQANLSDCNNRNERRLLNELKRTTTATEWTNLPIIMADLNQQTGQARQRQVVEKEQQIKRQQESQKIITEIKQLLNEFEFAEAEALFQRISTPTPGFDYVALTTAARTCYNQAQVAEVKLLLASYRFAEADRRQAQLVDLYPKADYTATRTAAWHKQQNEIEQALIALLVNGQFAEADQLYHSFRRIFLQSHYQSLHQHHRDIYEHSRQQVTLLTELRQLFEQDKFSEADKHFASHSHLTIDEYAKAKASYLQRYFSTHFHLELDVEQSAAVGMPAHSLLVTARAGSGKTRVLTSKAAYVMAVEGIMPDQMLLLAFNKEAAKTMRRRMCEILHMESFDTASTFDALAHALVEPSDRLLGDNYGRKSPRKIVENAITKLWENPMFAELVNKFFAQDMPEQQTWSTDINEDKLYETKRNLDNFSLRGEEVKSNGEKYIADFLYEYNIAHQYEYTHNWDGTPYHPDFTLFEGGQPKAIIEHWAIDESDPCATTPAHWQRSATEYRAEMVAKRQYWQQRNIPLVETSVTDLHAGRVNFENVLKRRLETVGIVCQQSNAYDLRTKLTVEKSDKLTELFLQFIQRAKKQGIMPTKVDLADSIGVELTRSEVFWQLAPLVYQEYEDEKGQRRYLDYDDLMAQAIARIHKECGKCTIDLYGTRVKLNELRWVLVDEFQDLSTSFYHLLEAIRRYNPTLKIFGVGDDWQSINAFAGADLTYFQRFDQLFVNPQHTNILTNYRSLPKIVESANRFMAGKGEAARVQNGKAGGILCINKIDIEMTFEPSMTSAPGQDPTNDRRFLFDDKKQSRNSLAERTLKRCWQIITHESNREKSIAILSRTNKIYGQSLDKFKTKLLALIGFTHQTDIIVSTIHNFKGQEKQVVILVEATKGLFPLIHKDNHLWGIFLRDGENVEARAEAEEERLFYVALTRAHEKLWILTEEARPSKFLDRL